MIIFKTRVGTIHMIVAALLIFLALGSGPDMVDAHAPESMELYYDFFSQILNVTITHTTPAPSQHYIESVEVFRNNVSIIQEEYTEQPSLRVFYLEFDVSAEDNDVLRVNAVCNIVGDLEEEIRVIGPKDRMYIEVNPEIEGIEMGEEQDFTVNIYETANDDPIEGVSVEVSTWLGTASEVSDLGLGGYSFTYTAPDLEDDDIDTSYLHRF